FLSFFRKKLKSEYSDYINAPLVVNYIFQKFKLRYNKYYGDVAGRYHIDTSEITDFGDDNIYEARDKLVEELVEERKSEPKKKHK
ncbi:hypothetical protein IBK48_10970, partial [Tetragenococcus halophilus]|nr:hypothetical protein [Tetragenococcus halophilus]